MVAAGAAIGVRVQESSAAAPYVAPTASASRTPALPTKPRLLVFGDSYTEGFAAQPLTDGYAYLVGKKLGWRTEVNGKGGTGFTFGGGDGASDYPTRLRAYIRSSKITPDVIVLEGSQNDFRDVNGVADAVVESVELLRRAYPDARIILFGPAAPQPLQNDLAPIDAADQLAADRLGIPYVSPYRDGWFTAANSDRYAYKDGSHLNTVGHAYLAQRFLEELEPLLGL